MDLSGIIFVALAVAWAAYLIPKALKHHDEVVRSRSVDRFSHTMRVLARREPVNTRDARLVVTPARGRSTTVVETKATSTMAGALPEEQLAEPTPAELRARRAAVRVATQRRRRVLGLILLVNVAVAVAAALGAIGWAWQAAPVGLLLAWLVACRLMVKKERAVPGTTVLTGADSAGPHHDSLEVEVEVDVEVHVHRNEQGFDELAETNETTTIPAVDAVGSGLWDPLPVTLPTYVGKPAAARRSVRTIALDDSGVWTSGHHGDDSALAREADKQRAEKRNADAGDASHRAVGS